MGNAERIIKKDESPGRKVRLQKGEPEEMLRNFLRDGGWFIFMVGLVAFTLVLSGCRGVIDDLAGRDNDGNEDNAFSAFKGVWKGVNIPVVATVEIAIDSPFAEGYLENNSLETQYFKERVTCSLFSGGHRDIETPDIEKRENYLAAIVYKNMSRRDLYVKAKEGVGSGSMNLRWQEF